MSIQGYQYTLLFSKDLKVNLKNNNKKILFHDADGHLLLLILHHSCSAKSRSPRTVRRHSIDPSIAAASFFTIWKRSECQKIYCLFFKKHNSLRPVNFQMLLWEKVGSWTHIKRGMNASSTTSFTNEEIQVNRQWKTDPLKLLSNSDA